MSFYMNYDDATLQALFSKTLRFLINMGKINTRIPGLSFSWKRALGITQAKQKIARQTGIPTSKAGIERKIGNMILKTLFGK